MNYLFARKMMPHIPGILTATALCLVGMLPVSCCHRFNFTEQLDAEDKRVPIISQDKVSDVFSDDVIYLHDGNYYRRIPVAYAKENTAIMTRKVYNLPGAYFSSASDLLPPRSYTDVQQWEAYYFPLSDNEVDGLLNRPAGTTKQPLSLQKAKPLKVSETEAVRPIPLRWVRGSFAVDSLSLSAYDKENAYCRIAAMPEQPGERTLSQKLLLAPAWALDAVGNTACFVLDVPGIVIIHPISELLEWLATPFVII